MDRYWAEGFPPHGVIEWLRRPWPLAQASELLGSDGANSFGYPAAPLFVVVLAAGLAVLARRGPAGRLVLAPLLVALAAGVAGQYPFSSRLAFFLVPGFVLALAAAAEQLAASLKHRWATSVVPACLAAVTSYPVLTTLPTYHRNDLRPLLEHLAADRRPDRKLYVYYGAAPAFWYYAPTMGLVDDALVPGGCHPGDPIQYLYELDTLRGARSVVLLINREEPDERADILGYLDTIGVRRSELRSSDHWFTRPTGTKAEAIEYDLSDADRLRAARADGFALRPHGPAPLIPCAHAPLSMPYTRVHP
jgi:hypothetical protein